MTVSLNSENKPIAYDTRIDYYIDKHHFAGELLFSFSLPILLSHFNECYCVDVDENSFDLPLLDEKRKVVIAGTRNWITQKSNEEQITAGFDNSKHHFFTTFVIAIEIKKDEISDVVNLFSLNKEELNDIVKALLQNSLEVAFYRYNEKAGGASFIVPTYKECDRIDLSFYINYIEKRYLRCAFIPFQYSIIGQSEIPIDREAFNQPVENWRYFLNKSLFDFSGKKYIDSIISAAISIEAYSWEKVCNITSSERELDEYVTENNCNGKTKLSATKLYKKLKDDGHLNTSLSKTKIEKYVQRILNPRNDIMHGKKSVAQSWREIARETNTLLLQFYKELNERTDEGLFLEKSSNNDDLDYKTRVLTLLESKFDSIEKEMDYVRDTIEHYPEMEFPRVHEIKLLLKTGNYGGAKENIDYLLETISNPSALAVETYAYYLGSNREDEVINLLKRISDKDERAYCVMTICLLSKYRKCGRTDKECLRNAIDAINRASINDTKYILRHVLAIEVMTEANQSTIDIAKSLVNKLTVDYWFPLHCANYYVKNGSLVDADDYYKIFLNRFREATHSKITIDFYTICFDIESICENAKRLNEILGKSNESLEKVLISVKNRPMDGTIPLLTISSVGRGGMPHGNIIYKSLPNIPMGTFIYK